MYVLSEKFKLPRCKFQQSNCGHVIVKKENAMGNLDVIGYKLWLCQVVRLCQKLKRTMQGFFGFPSLDWM